MSKLQLATPRGNTSMHSFLAIELHVAIGTGAHELQKGSRSVQLLQQ